MILKIQKPLFSSSGEELYLIYNKDRSVFLQNIFVGKNKKLDRLFDEGEYKIYVNGQVDKKGNIKNLKKIEKKDW